MKNPILVVDDEDSLRLFLKGVLAKAGYNVETANSVDAALAILTKRFFPLVITDLKMPEKNGLELVKEIKERYPDTEVIVITAYGTIEIAVEAMKAGASDFLVKPLPNPEYVRSVVEKIFARIKASNDEILLQALSANHKFIAKDEKSLSILKLLKLVAPKDTTILLTGETGTGKEVTAQNIHAMSPRKQKPFVAINCASLPENLLESELFGFEKGAFTGAIQAKPGKFVLADTGTLFLDEIGELPLALQAKLLRVLQEKQLEPIGSLRTRSIDVRIIAATNKDLSEEVLKGNFREDLYYRLNVFPIELPPLRERPKDILPLAEHFLRKYKVSLSPEATHALCSYSFPGNVRELYNILERAAILSQEKTITPQHLLLEQIQPKNKAISMETAEYQAITEALATTMGHRAKAAKLLGISVRALQYKIKKYNIQ